MLFSTSAAPFLRNFDHVPLHGQMQWDLKLWMRSLSQPLCIVCYQVPCLSSGEMPTSLFCAGAVYCSWFNYCWCAICDISAQEQDSLNQLRLEHSFTVPPRATFLHMYASACTFTERHTSISFSRPTIVRSYTCCHECRASILISKSPDPFVCTHSHRVYAARIGSLRPGSCERTSFA